MQHYYNGAKRKKEKNMTNEEMMETMKIAAELGGLATRYNLSEEAVEEIIANHNGDVKSAIRTIKTLGKLI